MGAIPTISDLIGVAENNMKQLDFGWGEAKKTAGFNKVEITFSKDLGGNYGENHENSSQKLVVTTAPTVSPSRLLIEVLVKQPKFREKLATLGVYKVFGKLIVGNVILVHSRPLFLVIVLVL